MNQGAPKIQTTIALLLIPIVFFSLALPSGCSSGKEEPLSVTIHEEDKEAAPALGAAPKAISVLCPEGIVPPELITGFADETGVTVVMMNPSDYPDMIGSIDTFDLVLVDLGTLAQIIEMGLAAEITAGDIPNLAGVSPPFSDPPVDSDSAFSVPCLWGSFGIAVNRVYITDPNIEWAVLFDPRFAGKIDMPDDVRFLVEVALREFGTWSDLADPQTLDLAADLIFEQKKVLRGYFLVPEIIDHLAEGSSFLGFLDDRSALAAAEKNDKIQYVVPQSGAPLWLLFWVVPRASENVKGAERFIDFLLDPRHIAAVSNAYLFANVVGGSRQYLNKELIETPSIILPEETLANSRFVAPVDLETENFMMRLKDDLMLR